MGNPKNRVFRKNPVFENLETLSQYAADLFVRVARDAVARHGRFLAALSGGGTPQRLYELLAQLPRLAQIPWAQTHFFWADERCVPPDADGSNYRQVREAILIHAPVPPANVHRVSGELSPPAAAAEYAQQLATFAAAGLNYPRFDLVLLGMGGDGHTASLFPGFDRGAADASPTLAVTAHYEGRPADRVTLTPPVLNAARQVVFLVAGAEKAVALARVWRGDGAEMPASLIQPHDGQLTWLVDAAAASGVKN